MLRPTLGAHPARDVAGAALDVPRPPTAVLEEEAVASRGRAAAVLRGSAAECRRKAPPVRLRPGDSREVEDRRPDVHVVNERVGRGAGRDARAAREEGHAEVVLEVVELLDREAECLRRAGEGRSCSSIKSREPGPVPRTPRL